jgi:DNA polymerase I-like protein with 3'-5' exonuclease and polymerase domains
MDLVQVVHQMRRRGIRIDETQASSVQEMMRQRREEALAEVARLWGRRCRMQDLRSPEALGALFTHAEVSVPLTKMTKKPSVTKSFLEGLRHPLGALVRSARQADEMAEKFIGNYIMGSSHRGRIHAEVHQLRSDEGGTITYRLSYSSPPLQQMPARDPVLAPPIRKIFLPERGNWWAAPDYSQQEPRLAVHFAALLNLHGAAEAVDYYATDPSADFHTMVARMTGLARSVAKIINLGLMYGMGVEKLAYSLRMTIEEAQELLATYHARVPWVKGLTDEAARLAKNRGFIRLIDGARCRFDLWQPRGRSRDDRTPAMRRPQAETLEANTAAVTGSRERELERAFSHKAMNKLVQGSAARQTKRAMLAMWRAGLLPLIQMHDELGLSVSSSSEGEMAAEIMRTVVPLRVPVKVDLEYGRTWGHAKHTWEEREAA